MKVQVENRVENEVKTGVSWKLEAAGSETNFGSKIKLKSKFKVEV
jgi:hypothetical protein